MNKIMEKISILSLSLILVSTYSISCVLPKMLEHFSDYPRERVELLVSIPSFGIACMILLNIWLTKVLSERISIVIGAVMISFAGLCPVIFKTYSIFLLSRIMLGFGIGMINARAVTIIQNRYDGKERASLLGIRGSMEVLGNTLLTFLAGRLMLLGWDIAFGVYLCIIPILVLYLIFVKPVKKQDTRPEKAGVEIDAEASAVVEANEIQKESSSVKSYIPALVMSFALGWVFINTNVSATMRMANLMLERSLGTETDASVVLSFMLICGVVAGLLFERLLRIFKTRIMVFALLCMGGGLVLISMASGLILLYLGGFFSGFANGILTTILFYDIAIRMPQEHMDLATYVTLLGCNLGAASSPIILKWIGVIRSGMTFSYLVYGLVCVVLAGMMLVTRNESEGDRHH